MQKLDLIVKYILKMGAQESPPSKPVEIEM